MLTGDLAFLPWNHRYFYLTKNLKFHCYFKRDSPGEKKTAKQKTRQNRRLTWQISILVSVPEVECSKPPTMSTNWSHASDRTLHNMMRLLRQSLSTRLTRLDSPPPSWVVFTKRNRASIDMQASETISTPEFKMLCRCKIMSANTTKKHKFCIFPLNSAIKSLFFPFTCAT